MYQLTDSSNIFRTTDGAYIPPDVNNTDYATYLTWLAEGNKPQPAPIPPVPQATSVTMRQARLALLNAGKLDQVNQAIAAMTGVQGQAAQIEWQYASEIKIDSPLISSLASGLGLTQTEIATLFNLAATL